MTKLLASLAIAPVKKGLQHGRWVEIRLDSGRTVRCSCGRSIQDAPHDFTQTMGLGACAHLNALYTGRITEDLRETKLYGSLGANGLNPLGAPRYYVRLTQLGSQMLRWRWAAQALSSTRG